MRVVIRVLGTEVVALELGDPPAQPGSGSEVSRHSGSFEIGFQSGPPQSWLPGDVEARRRPN